MILKTSKKTLKLTLNQQMIKTVKKDKILDLIMKKINLAHRK